MTEGQVNGFIGRLLLILLVWLGIGFAAHAPPEDWVTNFFLLVIPAFILFAVLVNLFWLFAWVLLTSFFDR